MAAGIRQLLERPKRSATPGVRVLPGRFMVIQQAMGTPASRGAPGSERCSLHFVEEMKASGFVADALKRHRIEGARAWRHAAI